MKKHSRGFTLIELMVTVAIIAILVSIAVASYSFATTKTRRSAAKGCLAQAAQYMERYYTLHFAYTDAADPPALPACESDVTDFYDVGFVAGQPTATTYAIEAVPTGSQATSDTQCGTLSLTDAGVKGANNVDACW